jgi:hypothetical protein
MKTTVWFALLLILALAFSSAAQQSGYATLSGAVVDRQGHPAPGLSVSLLGKKGETNTVTTDKSGRFVFANVKLGSVYYVEVYWGRDLMYRQPVTLTRALNLGIIRL